MKAFLSPVLAVVTFAGAGQAQTAVVVDNDQVRVLKAEVRPHEPVRMHAHNFNRVMIYMNAGTEDLSYEDGTTRKITWKAGTVEWAPVTGRHVATIASSDPVTVVEVELKNTGTDATFSAPRDPVKVDPRHYHVEFENRQVRVLRATLGPGESAPPHEHSLSRVVTFLTPQNVRVTEPDGTSSVARHARGDISWAGAARHSEVNLSNEPFEVIVVELK